METIKRINKTDVEIDNAIYRKVVFAPPRVEEPKPEFKEGNWVVQMMDKSDELGRIKIITDEHITYDDGSGHASWNGYIRHATKEEIESHLKKVCDEKYPKGAKFRSLSCDGIGIVRDEFSYYIKNDQLTNGNTIYRNGKWAEIIPDTKKLPNDKKGIGELIDLYHDQNDGLPFKTPVDEFLNDYE